jgi:Dihaem cytochrome c
MNIPTRPLVLSLLVVAFSALVLGRAQAGGGHFYAPVADAVVKEECGGCHLAFAPSMLPARSWTRMMGDLKHHFGTDASLDPGTANKITDYLTVNAADQAGQRYSTKLLRGLPVAQAPLRITALPNWVKEHGEIAASQWQQSAVRSKANCTACHASAERGYYQD